MSPVHCVRAISLITILASSISFSAAATAPSSSSLPAPVLPLSEVREGMTGYGLTVFHGSQIDTFGVRVLGVQRNARAQGSVILVELSGHGLEQSAIPEGMSGSPVFLNGRLAGAVAFSWEGALRPIGGLTPAEEMLTLPTAAAPADEEAGTGDESRARPRETSLAAWLDPEGRGAALAARVFGDGWNSTTGSRAGSKAPKPGQSAGDINRGREPVAAGQSRQERWPDPAALAQRLLPWVGAGAAAGSSGLTPLPAGLICRAAGEVGGAGEAGEASTRSTGELQQHSKSAAKPGAGSKVAGAPGRLVPGSAFGILLVGGDAEMGALGTVTWVRGDDVWTLGHPLLQAGALTVPMSAADIIGLFPSRQMSFKLGGFAAPVGAVHHDLRAGLTGQLGPVPPMVPVAVTVERPRGPEHFRFQVARDPRLTPALAYWCLYNAMLTRGDDLTQQTIRWQVTTRWRAGGHDAPPLVLEGIFAGPSSGSTLQAEWTAPLSILLDNRHETLELTAVDAVLRIAPGADEALIAGMDAPAAVRAGQTIPVSLTIQPRRSPARTLRYELDLPARLPPGDYRLVAASARDIFALESERAPERFADRSLSATLAVLRMPRSTAELSLVLYARPTGIVVNGRELPDLPPSIGGELLRAGTGRTGATRAAIVAREDFDAGEALQGAAIAAVRILPPSHMSDDDEEGNP